jgi:predicted ribosome quality control (RQC) complex YloA/Tae2 family protein
MNVLRSALGTRYGPTLIEHALALSNVSPGETDFTHLLAPDSGSLKSLVAAFQKSDDILQLKDNVSTLKGYILANVDAYDQIIFEEFHPFLPAYYVEGEKTKTLIFDSFDEAVDEFYSKVEAQKLMQKAKQAEQHALKKLETVKQNSENQVKSLQFSQEKKELMALAIESNLELVDNAIKTICSFVASGMNWDDLEDLVKEEQATGNSLALAIVGLKLKQGIISISLSDPRHVEEDDGDFDGDSIQSEDEEEPAGKVAKATHTALIVDVDINCNAWQNARSYYDAKKLAVVKGQKTIQASVKAVEQAEKKIMATLEKTEKKAPTITKYRTPYWFEKYLWFLSSGTVGQLI